MGYPKVDAAITKKAEHLFELAKSQNSITTGFLWGGAPRFFEERQKLATMLLDLMYLLLNGISSLTTPYASQEAKIPSIVIQPPTQPPQQIIKETIVKIRCRHCGTL